VHDHGGIVIDEVAGYLVTMIAVPVNLWTLVAAFVVFRFFDIIKPWPIGWLDRRVQGGLGIMVDDLLAGIYIQYPVRSYPLRNVHQYSACQY